MRVCVCGCGKKLVDKRGLPDFKRHFWSKECRARDRVAHLRLKRSHLKKNKRQCSGCNRSTRSLFVKYRGKKVGIRSLQTAFKFGKLVERERLKGKEKK